MYYAVIDTETGGTDPNTHSLLQVSIAVVDVQSLEIKEHFTYDLNHGNDYVVTPEAMRVNGIDLAEHHPKSVYIDDVAEVLYYQFLPYGKLIPCGWNVAFDVEFLKQQMFLGDWNRLFTYRVTDVQSLAFEAAVAGKIPQGSLKETAEYFGLNTENHHDAKTDVLLTLEVLKRIRAL